MKKNKNGKYFCEQWSLDTKFCIKYNKKLHSETSKFQKIDFFESNEYGIFFTLDDCIMYTEKDEFIYHEMITHPAFLVNSNIKNILIIGGGDGGTVRELLKHKEIEKIDLVEIDKRVVELSAKYYKKNAIGLKNNKVNIYFEDGVEFVKKQKNESYDFIIIDSTDPISIGEGLFNENFYKQIKRLLSRKGIVINQNESLYFSEFKKNFEKVRKVISKTFKYSTPYHISIPTYPSGTWYFSFSSNFFNIEKMKFNSKNKPLNQIKYFTPKLFFSSTIF